MGIICTSKVIRTAFVKCLRLNDPQRCEWIIMNVRVCCVSLSHCLCFESLFHYQCVYSAPFFVFLTFARPVFVSLFLFQISHPQCSQCTARSVLLYCTTALI